MKERAEAALSRSQAHPSHFPSPLLRTCTIRRDYLHFIRKYNRFEKRHKMLSVHVSPAFRDIQVGDQVVVGECRPLSKVCLRKGERRGGV